MKITGTEKRHGEKTPFGYGFAWDNFNTDTVVCYPIPFNWLARWVRNTYWFLARGKRSEALLAIYQAGFSHGQQAVVASELSTYQHGLILDDLHKRAEDLLKNGSADI